MSNVYIEVGKNNIIQRIHRSPFDPVYGLQTPKDELLKTGFFIDEVPEPKIIEGKRAIAKYNPDSKQVYYDYEDIPMTANERMDLIESALNEVLLSGMEE